MTAFSNFVQIELRNRFPLSRAQWWQRHTQIALKPRDLYCTRSLGNRDESVDIASTVSKPGLISSTDQRARISFSLLHTCIERGLLLHLRVARNSMLKFILYLRECPRIKTNTSTACTARVRSQCWISYLHSDHSLNMVLVLVYQKKQLRPQTPTLTIYGC